MLAYYKIKKNEVDKSGNLSEIPDLLYKIEAVLNKVILDLKEEMETI